MLLKERIRRELERINQENGGLATPEQVVEAARDEDNPLHSWFTWDDSEAAKKWRIHQARNLLRLQVEIVGETNVRAFISLVPDRKTGGGYRELTDILADEALHQQMLDDAMAELRVFRRKYAALQSLTPLWASIDAIERSTTKPTVNQASA
jgi:hypothetical protein